MTLGQLLSVFAARWRTALVVLLLAISVGVALSFLLPRAYRSSATVMIDVRTPDPVGGVPIAGMLSSTFMTTQVELIKSEQVARKAISALGLTQSAEVIDQWREATDGKGEFEPWLAEALLKKLTVTPSRDSNVISVSYESPDPRFSAALTNAFVQAYVDTTVELRADPAKLYNNFFDNRAKELRDALEVAQKRLSSYQTKNGLLATDERLDVENHRLSELSSQLLTLQAIAVESGGRQDQAGTRPEQMSEVLNNPVVANLSAEVAREEARILELVERLGPNHPQLASARAQLQELRQRKADAQRIASGSVTVNNSVNQMRVAQVRGALEAQRARVLQLKSLRDEAAVLQRDVENAQRAYDAILVRVSQTNVESQNTQSNISIIKRASVSPKPSSPNTVLIVLVSLVLGTLLAIGAALIRELRDRRLRTKDDVLLDLGKPLLAVLPISKLASGGKETARLRMSKTRVITGLLRPAKSS
ncbi:MAG: chain length determinant protein EpsF [Rubrivivax sp.]|nr:chain length determinant protein EpsF [Rubrivivax sp.]